MTSPKNTTMQHIKWHILHVDHKRSCFFTPSHANRTFKWRPLKVSPTADVTVRETLDYIQCLLMVLLRRRHTSPNICLAVRGTTSYLGKRKEVKPRLTHGNTLWRIRHNWRRHIHIFLDARLWWSVEIATSVWCIIFIWVSFLFKASAVSRIVSHKASLCYYSAWKSTSRRNTF